MSRIIDFFDGAQSETTPTIGNIIASAIIKYADDATYEATEQGAPDTGNIYYNTTLNLVRYYNGTIWISIVDEQTLQTIHNKIIDGSSTGDNTVKTIGVNVEIIPSGNITSNEVSSAINELDTNKIETSEKGAALGVATLDAGGLIPSAQIPPIALTSVSVVADNAARDALTVEEGDVAQTLDSGKWWIYDGASWQEMVTPASVTSVNGQTGTVDLNLDDITGVDLSTVSPVVDDVIKFDGTNWIPSATVDSFETVTTRTVTGTLLITEEVVLLDSTAAAMTLNMPTAAGSEGKKYRFKKISTDNNQVSFNPDGVETIDSELTYSLYLKNEGLTVVSDGTNWHIISENIEPIVVSAGLNTNKTQSGVQDVLLDAEFIDNTLSFSTTTGFFTAPAPGDYRVTANMLFGFVDTNTNGTLIIAKNGSNVAQVFCGALAGTPTSQTGVIPGVIISLLPGDTLNLRSIGDASYTLDASSARASFTVERIKP